MALGLRGVVLAVAFVLTGCQTTASPHNSEDFRDVVQIVDSAQKAFLEASRDGGASTTAITKSDGTVIEGKSFFNSTEPMSIHEIRPGIEAIAVGHKNCFRSDRPEWNCQNGGIYLGLFDLNEANIKSARVEEGVCTFGACKIVGVCLSGRPQLGESDDEKDFWILEDASTFHCLIIRLKANSLLPVSMEDSEYVDGRQIIRAFDQFDMDQPVGPITLPSE